MRTNILLIIFLVITVVPCLAQNVLITSSSERNPDNSISIFTECQGQGEYTVKLIFTSLSGYTTSTTIYRNTALVNVTRGKREVIKLIPVNGAPSYSYQYRYQYYPGRALRKAPDSSFAYLLPAKAGNSLRISKVSFLEEQFGQNTQEEYYATGFVFKLGDTICATRGGVVYECDDKVKKGEDANTLYKRARNILAIQHKDGSIARYTFIAPIHLLISSGDLVYPGQPLAIFDKESERYQLFFSTYYLNEKKILAEENITNTPPSPCIDYMPTYYYVNENNRQVALQVNKVYPVQISKEVVVAEMTKRERKILGY